MPAGLQVFDAASNLYVDLTHWLGRILGSFSTGTTAGSHTDAGLATGTPFYIITGYAASGGSTPPPTISLTGTTLSWPAGQNALVVYGIY